MSPSDLLFAAMLLSAPMGTPEAAPTPERWPAVRDALHQTAVDWEILDSRERRYVLTKREDFQDDLDFLRKRRAELPRRRASSRPSGFPIASPSTTASASIARSARTWKSAARGRRIAPISFAR